MKILLVGGNKCSGKTDTLDRLCDWLKNTQGFVCKSQFNHFGSNPKDKGYYLTRSTGKIRTILLNVAADNSDCIKNLDSFIKTINLPSIDADDFLFITAIRNPISSACTNNPRQNFLDYISNEFKKTEKDCIEIPMLHIDARLNNQKQWIKNKTDEIIHIVLESSVIGL